MNNLETFLYIYDRLTVFFRLKKKRRKSTSSSSSVSSADESVSSSSSSSSSGHKRHKKHKRNRSESSRSSRRHSSRASSSQIDQNDVAKSGKSRDQTSYPKLWGAAGAERVGLHGCPGPELLPELAGLWSSRSGPSETSHRPRT